MIVLVLILHLYLLLVCSFSSKCEYAYQSIQFIDFQLTLGLLVKHIIQRMKWDNRVKIGLIVLAGNTMLHKVLSANWNFCFFLGFYRL